MRREVLLLREMRDAAVEIQLVVGSQTPEELGASTLHRSALLWQFTVLGEAANQIPPEIHERFPDFAWRDVTRLRNRIVHGYWEIELAVPVATAVNDLPDMVSALTIAIDTSDES